MSDPPTPSPADAPTQDPTAIVHATMPLCATLGVTASRFEADEVVLQLDWKPELCTTGGLLHGGVVMALADSAGAACAYLNLPEGAAGTATITSSTSFLGAVKGGAVTATSTLLHRGGSTIAVETAVTDDAGRLVGKVMQTQAVLRPRS
ncbi:MAG: PaaI family thioesterase [Acidimicrobiales bacterium]|nr:PaaI family thioesterase [Acidimicrobiales bacterium]